MRTRLRLSTGTTAPKYYALMGTDLVTAALTGWMTFGLNGANRRVWIDATNGSDGNSGLSAAAAKQTWDAGFALFIAGSPGDQLMVAGNGTYTDTGANNIKNFGGISPTYPTAILSYDPSDAANPTKYGRLTGSNVPKINLPVGPGASLGIATASGANCIASQGLEFTSSPTLGGGINLTFKHDYIVYQNCRFNHSSLAFSDNAGPSSANCCISRCSSWGVWDNSGTSGNAQGVFAAFTDRLCIEDFVSVHNGWKIGASRSDTVANGGPNFLGHGDYLTAHETNVHVNRCVYVDSARDGFNARGNIAGTCITSWDEPLGGQIGGVSGTYLEAQYGVLVTVDDYMIMGADSLSGGVPMGYAFDNINTVAGSYVRNAALFDNPYYGTGNNQYLSAVPNDPNQVNQYLLLDNIRGYNYANLLEGSHGANASLAHSTWTNCILDVAATGTNNSVWNAGTFPNAKTRDQVVTTLLTNLGVTPGASYTARKAQLVNLMCWRPDIQWGPLFQWIGLPAYGLTPTKTLLLPYPNLSAETPVTVY